MRGVNISAVMLLTLGLMAGFVRIGWAQYNPDASGPPEGQLAAPVKLPPAKPASPVPKPAAPAKLEHMQKAQAEDILGDAVLDAKGQQIGRIVNVLVNGKGTPHAAVIEFAGFLGVGNRNIAVAWKALNFKVVKNQIVISLYLDASQIKAMPVYDTDAKSVPVAAPAKPLSSSKSASGSSAAGPLPEPPPPAPPPPEVSPSQHPAPAPQAATPAGKSDAAPASGAETGSSHQGANSPSGSQ